MLVEGNRWIMRKEMETQAESKVTVEVCTTDLSKEENHLIEELVEKLYDEMKKIIES